MSSRSHSLTTKPKGNMTSINEDVKILKEAREKTDDLKPLRIEIGITGHSQPLDYNEMANKISCLMGTRLKNKYFNGNIEVKLFIRNSSITQYKFPCSEGSPPSVIEYEVWVKDKLHKTNDDSRDTIRQAIADVLRKYYAESVFDIHCISFIDTEVILKPPCIPTIGPAQMVDHLSMAGLLQADSQKIGYWPPIGQFGVKFMNSKL